jgi:glutathione S-transferase
LEELGLEYEIVRYTRDARTLLAPPELLAVHPLGKSPVLTDDGRTIAESGAIIEYVLDRYGEGRLRPEVGSEARIRYDYFLHYAEGSAMPLLLLQLVTSRLTKPPVPFFLRPSARLLVAGLRKKLIAPQLARHLAFLEAELGSRTWFVGDELTAADIQMSFAVEGFLARGGEASPRLLAFRERAMARPAYQRALSRGGPFSIS